MNNGRGGVSRERRNRGSAAAHVDARGRGRAEETTLRLGLSRLTVDVLPVDVGIDAIPTIVSDGELGSPPTTGEIDASTVAMLLVAADFVRPRRVIDTPAWAFPSIEVDVA